MTKLPILFLIFSTSSTLSYAGSPSDLRQSYTYEGQKNYEYAIRAMAPLYNSSPKDFFVNLRLGWLNYLNGNYRNSITHYDAALALSPKSITALQGKLGTLIAQGRWDEARLAAHGILAILPNDYTATLRLANISIYEKRFKDAISTLRSLLPYYPESAELLNTLGYAYQLDGDSANAQKVFNRVLSSAPDNAIALTHLQELTR